MTRKYSISRIIPYVFLTLFFIFSGIYQVYAAILLDRVVALVNNEVITWSELYKMMERETTDEMKSLDEEEKKKMFKEGEEVFLNRLIDLRLQLQEAKRVEIVATPEEVENAIENIKTKYDLTDDEMKRSLEKEGLTFEEYKKKLSEQIVISKLVSQQVRSKIVISDEEINDYLGKNRKEFVWDESYKLRQIFFKRPSDEDMNKDIEEKASHIMEKLKEGEDFSYLAQEYSEDTTKKFGGAMGYIQKKSLAKEFIDALADMKTGDFSKPFWSEKGLHIIKLEDKKSAQTEDEVKEEIRDKLLESKFMRKYDSWLKDLRNKAHIVMKL